jgi:hypothetical protein
LKDSSNSDGESTGKCRKSCSGKNLTRKPMTSNERTMGLETGGNKASDFSE